MANSSILAWKIPWTEEPDGLQQTRDGGKDSASSSPFICGCLLHDERGLLFLPSVGWSFPVGISLLGLP